MANYQTLGSVELECEELMAYRERFEPHFSTGLYANIPLIEENEKELKELAERIREACKQQEAENEAQAMIEMGK